MTESISYKSRINVAFIGHVTELMNSIKLKLLINLLTCESFSDFGSDAIEIALRLLFACFDRFL